MSQHHPSIGLLSRVCWDEQLWGHSRTNYLSAGQAGHVFSLIKNGLIFGGTGDKNDGTRFEIIANTMLFS